MNTSYTHPGDIIIGEITSHYNENNYNLKVSHIGLKNKASYRDFEMIQIKNRIPKKMLGTTIRCTVQYRDVYDRLLCTIEKVTTNN